MTGRRPRLPHRRVLTALAVAGLATAVALPVVLLSVGGGVYAHEIAELADSGYQIQVSTDGDHGIDGAHGLAARLGAIPGVGNVSPVLSDSVDIFVGSVATPALAEGVVPGPFLATIGPQETGLFPHPLPLGDPTDTLHFANGTYAGPSAGRILLSTPFAASAHVAVGTTVRVGDSTNLTDTEPFDVAGLFGASGPSIGPSAVFGAVLPLSDLQVIAGLAFGPNGTVLDAADSLEIGLTATEAASPSDIAAVAHQITAIVPYYSVSQLDDEAGQLAQAEGILRGFYLGLSGVGLTIGLAFLALVLVREVELERRTIGIRRALGLPTRAIAAEILGRGFFLAAAGAIGGVALGIATVRVLALDGHGTVAEVANLAEFAPGELALLALGVVALSGIAGLAALRAALRLSIPEALR